MRNRLFCICCIIFLLLSLVGCERYAGDYRKSNKYFFESYLGFKEYKAEKTAEILHEINFGRVVSVGNRIEFNNYYDITLVNDHKKAIIVSFDYDNYCRSIRNEDSKVIYNKNNLGG